MNTLKIQDLMHSSGVAFGTSGARGLVTQMTDALCATYTTAFLTVVKTNFNFKRVAIGIDLRPSSPAIAAACITAIRAAGLDVVFCGELPTPALALYCQQEQIPAIMVTGSHIPFDRNGLKFYRPDGEITKTDEAAIRALNINPPNTEVATALPPVNAEALRHYQQRYLNFFPQNMLKGKRLGLYEHSSVARDCLKHLLETLGAEVISLGRTDIFVPIDTEAVAIADVQQGLNWSAQYQFDSIISTDGDGDRPLMSDEHGNWLRGDIVGLLCARYLKIKQLAVPISCNTGIELSNAFDTVLRTQIGSPYVIAAMQRFNPQTGSIAGFEANGGFLLGSSLQHDGHNLNALPTRDAVLPVLALLAAAKERNSPISALCNDLPKRYTASDRLQNCPTQNSQEFLKDCSQNPEQFNAFLGINKTLPIKLDLTDGLRMTFNNDEIIHLRASGNAPELRCYCEADTLERAANLNNAVLKHLATTLTI